MRTTLSIIVVALAALSICGCKDKPKTDDIITQKVVKPKPTKPIRMQGYKQSKEVNWQGSRLLCVIEREADDSLPMVKDVNGQKYVDNRITVRITRTDGSEFFKKSFTKATFTEKLDDDYRRTGILEGLVFDKVEGDKLRFAASVCHPQTDEYIPLVVTVSRQGAMAVSRDVTLDTNGDDGDDGDEQ